MPDELLNVDRDGALVSLTITREEKMNALSRATLDALHDGFKQVAAMDGLRCVLLRSAGTRYFAAGGDLIELTGVKTCAEIEAMADHARAVLDAVRRCHVPVVAVLNGDAIGGGAELAVACDFRFMRRGAHIGFIQGRMAINSAWGGGPDLTALVGPSRALRMMARNELIGAELARDWGLADEIAAADELEGKLAEFLRPITQQSQGSLSAFLELARAERRGDSYEERRRLERDALLKTWPHPDHWRAVEKFLARKQN